MGRDQVGLDGRECGMRTSIFKEVGIQVFDKHKGSWEEQWERQLEKLTEPWTEKP